MKWMEKECGGADRAYSLLLVGVTICPVLLCEDNKWVIPAPLSKQYRIDLIATHHQEITWAVPISPQEKNRSAYQQQKAKTKQERVRNRSVPTRSSPIISVRQHGTPNPEQKKWARNLWILAEKEEIPRNNIIKFVRRYDASDIS